MLVKTNFCPSLTLTAAILALEQRHMLLSDYAASAHSHNIFPRSYRTRQRIEMNSEREKKSFPIQIHPLSWRLSRVEWEGNDVQKIQQEFSNSLKVCGGETWCEPNAKYLVGDRARENKLN